MTDFVYKNHSIKGTELLHETYNVIAELMGQNSHGTFMYFVFMMLESQYNSE